MQVTGMKRSIFDVCILPIAFRSPLAQNNVVFHLSACKKTMNKLEANLASVTNSPKFGADRLRNGTPRGD